MASTHLSLRDNLHDVVESLPSNNHPESYQLFINKWGTHFSQLVRFGGLAYQTIHLEASQYQKLLEQLLSLT